jgi:hypothetical protein
MWFFRVTSHIGFSSLVALLAEHGEQRGTQLYGKRCRDDPDLRGWERLIVRYSCRRLENAVRDLD